MPIVLAYVEPPGVAAPASPGPAVITNPDWAEKPNPQDLGLPRPMYGTKGGKAVIHCRVNDVGKVGHCVLVSETPLHRGVGRAALDMAPMFRMRPKTVDGQSVSGGTIDIPIQFLDDR